VLSPPTAAHDPGIKLADCRRLATVEQILMVASEDRHVEVWRRAEGGWHVQDLIGDGVVSLAIDASPWRSPPSTMGFCCSVEAGLAPGAQARRRRFSGS
jgi:hypothetical protein